MSTPANAAEACVAVATEFERSTIPYAVGGALAYGLYGVARATSDVDFNVFLETDALDPAFDALQRVGVALDRGRARADALSQGLFVGHLGNFRVDVFTPSIAFSWEALRRRVRAPFGGGEYWFLSAESLCVFKLLFFRSKDIVDLERLVATQQRRLDAPWVRQHIVEMMGEGDPRVATWDRLVAEFMPPT